MNGDGREGTGGSVSTLTTHSHLGVCVKVTSMLDLVLPSCKDVILWPSTLSSFGNLRRHSHRATKPGKCKAKDESLRNMAQCRLWPHCGARLIQKPTVPATCKPDKKTTSTSAGFWMHRCSQIFLHSTSQLESHGHLRVMLASVHVPAPGPFVWMTLQVYKMIPFSSHDESSHTSIEYS